MTPQELERYLHEQIPLSQAMQVQVRDLGADAVTLLAPLAPNRNHRATVFGGSAASLALLAGWSLLHTRLEACGVRARLVIQRSQMEYLKPIDGTFTATARLALPEEWETFVAMLTRRRRARMALVVQLAQQGACAGTFRGEYVALGPHSG
jgi:thioesterase domain-containing protein